MKIKIKYVKEPNPNHPGECVAVYDSETKSIWIRKYTRKKKIPEIIAHEMGHYYVDIFFSIPQAKHYLNLLWDYTWIILFTYGNKKADLIWYHRYYRDNAKKGQWQY